MAFERVWLSVSKNNRVTNQILLGLKDDATVGYDPQYYARKPPESSSMGLAFVQDSAIYLILTQPTIILYRMVFFFTKKLNTNSYTKAVTLPNKILSCASLKNTSA